MKNMYLLCLCTTLTHAVIEIENRSAVPAMIDTITILSYNGIKHVPVLQKKDITLGENQRITQQQLTGKAIVPITSITIVYKKIHYIFTIPATRQQGTIQIGQDGGIHTSGAIRLLQKPPEPAKTLPKTWGIRHL